MSDQTAEERDVLLEADLARKRDLAHDFLETFSTDAGQRVLAHLKAKGFVGKTVLARPMVGAPVDPLETARNEGMRTMVELILDAMHTAREVTIQRAMQRHAISSTARQEP